MLLRTHFAITIFGILLLISSVENKFVFVFFALLATVIPDVDSRYSKIGRKKVNRILQFFTKHRGLTHSFIFLILITLFFVFVIPKIALGFFLGYGLHLLADSFTKEGITPFYPFLKFKSRGSVATGGRIEVVLFVGFFILDFVLFLFGVLRV